MTPDHSDPFRVALVSMPWPMVNRPSLQLATLKSFLENTSSCSVVCFHLYLHLAQAIGIDAYSRIARSGWAGEALFAPLLFPDMKVRAKRLFQQSVGRSDPLYSGFEDLLDRVDQCFSRWLSETRLNDFRLIGFSVCFFQLLPSLYLAARMKNTCKDLQIVFGGSSCSGQVGESLFDAFQQIDFLVSGEGEQALDHLHRYIEQAEDSLPPGILSRHSSTRNAVVPSMIDLDQLPYPDYRGYFLEMRSLFPKQIFIPVLPIEFSRGCWWNRCSFCNLNLQWADFRCKSSERMLAETLCLAKTHGCLQFAFTDNALPQREADLFFADTAETGMDLDFFAEIRVITDEKRLQLYSRGGLRTVQVGIEALSAGLLAKMAKGTTVIDNIAAMKLACSLSMQLEGNLIIEFPGTTEEEIAETLSNLDFVLPFAPLQAASFFLGYGSPIYGSPENFSITAILSHPKNKCLFPEETLASLTMICNSYRGDRMRQRVLWRPVAAKLQALKKFHHARKTAASPPLYYRDGGTFLIIHQEQLDNPTLTHRVKGLSREIYLFCGIPRTLGAVCETFPSLSCRALENFFNEMHNKRLMFREGDRVLSLAVRLRR